MIEVKNFNKTSKFASIVCKTIESPPQQLEERLCPDQVIGTLDQLKFDGKISTRATSVDRPSRSLVLMVLESPHISEFTGDVGPAKGNTGKALAKHALSVPGLQGWGNAPILLINAIQYQCSLGKKTALYRDKVFLATWNEFGKSDFVARLRKAYRPSDLVVCACTKGGIGEVSIRELVYAAMVDALPQGTLILRRTHPSSWFSSKNRSGEWIFSDT